MKPRFRMFAGPNGSGKTVLFTHLRNKGYIHTELYLSADRIEHDLKHNRKFFFSSYRIKATEAEFRQSFCYETVLSHPSKLTFFERAKASGYGTYLYFVCTDTWKLNVERVKLRVHDGGHDVKKEKVKSRYFRSMKNLRMAANMADSSFLIDNSREFTRIAELKNGAIIFATDPFPEWMVEYFDQKMV